MAGDTHLRHLLSELRRKRSYSIRKMAEVCGVSRESIRKYELGKLIPSNQSLTQVLSALEVNETESRQLQLAVYQARRTRDSGSKRSFGPSAQFELEAMFTDTENLESKIDKLAELFFSEVGPERRSESFKFYLTNKITKILRS